MKYSKHVPITRNKTVEDMCGAVDGLVRWVHVMGSRIHHPIREA
jgi:hypothetical protein